VFGTDYSDLYDNSILWVDSLLGILFDRLEEFDLLDKTLIVFASDHGEAFGEHEGEGHARNVYGEVTETPLILHFPFRLEPGVVVNTRSENVDLWPTVLDLLDLPGLSDPDGRSLVPEIVAAVEGEPDLGQEDMAFAQLDQTWGKSDMGPRPMVAINDGRWRLIYRAATPRKSELYDKLDDPAEQTDVADREPEVLERLNTAARAYLESAPPPWGDETPELEIDEIQLQQLRAIGYGVR
ncbi:MAG: sulfatase-like hydrolase/transferase, partial [Myxococcota bacterium]